MSPVGLFLTVIFVCFAFLRKKLFGAGDDATIIDGESTRCIAAVANQH
jgi:hypothetical protein